jgi:Flp pilus assembly protein protease CpaA
MLSLRAFLLFSTLCGGVLIIYIMDQEFARGKMWARRVD